MSRNQMPPTWLPVPPRRPVTSLLGAVATLLVILAFGLVAARFPVLERAELPVVRWFSQHHSGFLTVAADTMVVVFEPTTGALLLVLVAIVLLLRARRVLVPLTFLVVTFGTLAYAQVLKWLVQRHRPPLSALADPPPSDPTFSFPSGHTTVVTVMVTALVLLLPGVSKWVTAIVGGVLVILVALSRVYLGSHYPTDVAASIVVGIAGVVTWHIVLANWTLPLLRRLKAEGEQDHPVDSHPAESP